MTAETHNRGIESTERYGFLFYDAMIVTSAFCAGWNTLYSEDVEDGQVIDGQLTIRNPFASERK